MAGSPLPFEDRAAASGKSILWVYRVSNMSYRPYEPPQQGETSLGIDLTGSPERPSAYAIINAGRRLLDMGFFAHDEEALSIASRHQPHFVAIDAPLSLPLGLDCLEESHLCHAKHQAPGRSGERELAHFGIGCFWTTKRSIIKSMVYRGMALKRRLAVLGFSVLEVYPYATKVILWGRRLPKKTSAEGMAFLSTHLGIVIQGLPPVIPNHDIADALVAAYTAYLHGLGKTLALGDPEEGEIIVPAFQDLSLRARGQRA